MKYTTIPIKDKSEPLVSEIISYVKAGKVIHEIRFLTASELESKADMLEAMEVDNYQERDC